MSETSIKRASLAELRKLKDDGKLFHDSAAPEGDELSPDFWGRARVETRKPPRSVHLKLDPEVFEFFYEETKGKGHITRMQAVLKAYADAHRKAG